MKTKTLTLTKKKKTKLNDYFGTLSKDSGDILEKNIKRAREKHKKSREKRIKDISRKFLI